MTHCVLSSVDDVARGTLCHLIGGIILLLPFVRILLIDTREIEILFSNKASDIYSPNLECFFFPIKWKN